MKEPVAVNAFPIDHKASLIGDIIACVKNKFTKFDGGVAVLFNFSGF
ncbi:MAG: hypothetical protein P8J14_09035 [Emcibacteraceae bacterium]|nr:hypothetical protein [Emcibacteraceae bacterium]